MGSRFSPQTSGLGKRRRVRESTSGRKVSPVPSKIKFSRVRVPIIEFSRSTSSLVIPSRARNPLSVATSRLRPSSKMRHRENRAHSNAARACPERSRRGSGVELFRPSLVEQTNSSSRSKPSPTEQNGHQHSCHSEQSEESAFLCDVTTPALPHSIENASSRRPRVLSSAARACPERSRRGSGGVTSRNGEKHIAKDEIPLRAHPHTFSCQAPKTA